MMALTDLGKGLYKGEPGGLYPAGVNTPPRAHLEAGLRASHEIVPLDGNGRRVRKPPIRQPTRTPATGRSLASALRISPAESTLATLLDLLTPNRSPMNSDSP